MEAVAPVDDAEERAFLAMRQSLLEGAAAGDDVPAACRAFPGAAHWAAVTSQLSDAPAASAAEDAAQTAASHAHAAVAASLRALQHARALLPSHSHTSEAQLQSLLRELKTSFAAATMSLSDATVASDAGSTPLLDRVLALFTAASSHGHAQTVAATLRTALTHASSRSLAHAEASDALAHTRSLLRDTWQRLESIRTTLRGAAVSALVAALKEVHWPSATAAPPSHDVLRRVSDCVCALTCVQLWGWSRSGGGASSCVCDMPLPHTLWAVQILARPFVNRFKAYLAACVDETLALGGTAALQPNGSKLRAALHTGLEPELLFTWIHTVEIPGLEEGATYGLAHAFTAGVSDACAAVHRSTHHADTADGHGTSVLHVSVQDMCLAARVRECVAVDACTSLTRALLHSDAHESLTSAMNEAREVDSEQDDEEEEEQGEKQVTPRVGDDAIHIRILGGDDAFADLHHVRVCAHLWDVCVRFDASLPQRVGDAVHAHDACSCVRDFVAASVTRPTHSLCDLLTGRARLHCSAHATPANSYGSRRVRAHARLYCRIFSHLMSRTDAALARDAIGAIVTPHVTLMCTRLTAADDDVGATLRARLQCRSALQRFSRLCDTLCTRACYIAPAAARDASWSAHVLPAMCEALAQPLRPVMAMPAQSSKRHTFTRMLGLRARGLQEDASMPMQPHVVLCTGVLTMAHEGMHRVSRALTDSGLCAPQAIFTAPLTDLVTQCMDAISLACLRTFERALTTIATALCVWCNDDDAPSVDCVLRTLQTACEATQVLLDAAREASDACSGSNVWTRLCAPVLTQSLSAAWTHAVLQPYVHADAAVGDAYSCSRVCVETFAALSSTHLHTLQPFLDAAPYSTTARVHHLYMAMQREPRPAVEHAARVCGDMLEARVWEDVLTSPRSHGHRHVLTAVRDVLCAAVPTVSHLCSFDDAHLLGVLRFARGYVRETTPEGQLRPAPVRQPTIAAALPTLDAAPVQEAEVQPAVDSEEEDSSDESEDSAPVLPPDTVAAPFPAAPVVDEVDLWADEASHWGNE